MYTTKSSSQLDFNGYVFESLLVVTGENTHKDDDFILKIDDFLLKNDGFLLKNDESFI